MTKRALEKLVSGYGLVEGPLWKDGRGLYFSDVQGGGVHLLSESGKTETVFPHRKGIGGLVEHVAGGLIVGGRNIEYRSFDDQGRKVLLERDITPTAVGFNDFTTDSAGRLFVGSVGYSVLADEDEVPGHLHVIDLDGSVRTVSDGITLTNGMGFSPDGTRLYHSDARGGVVRVYPVRDGEVGPWETFAAYDAEDHPDGLTVAADGAVVVAVAMGSRADVYEPDGTLRESIPVPLPMVTSVAFGGAGLKDLFIVTGSRGAADDHSGTIFRTSIDVPGLPVPLCRVGL